MHASFGYYFLDISMTRTSTSMHLNFMDFGPILNLVRMQVHVHGRGPLVLQLVKGRDDEARALILDWVRLMHVHNK